MFSALLRRGRINATIALEDFNKVVPDGLQCALTRLRGGRAAAAEGAARLSQATPAPAVACYPAGPGCEVHVRLSNPGSSLDVVLGGHPEAVELRPAGTGSSPPRPTLEQARLRVAHNPSGARDGHAPRLEVQEADDAPAQRLQVATPARFISLHAQTAGGSASVELIHEGSLRLATAGGAIAVARAKAVAVDLASGGGHVSGSLSGVDVALRSGGGHVSLKRLEGRRVSLDSGGGDVAITAAFGEELRLASGGGAVRLGSLNCQEGVARVSSGGGCVEVGGVDGGLQVASAGGPVSLQLNDRAGEVHVDSGGGDISLFVSPSLVGRLRVLRSGGVDASGGGRLGAGGRAGGTGAAAAAARGSCEEAGAPGNRVTPPPHAVVTLDAGEHGRIVVRERSWMEAMRQRLRHGSRVDVIGA